MSFIRSFAPIIFMALLVTAPAAHAQFAVIDVAAVARLTTELQTLDQSLVTARQRLAEAQAQYQSMTGDRGMEGLLTGIDRNYLPQSWDQLTAALAGGGGSFGALSATMQQALAQDAVLTPAQMNWLSPDARKQLTAERNSTGMLQALSRQALANVSGRFASLEQLIGAIGTASDQKAVLDLQARIAAEQAMLQNEQTKLRVLFAATEAQHWAVQDEAKERAIAQQGNFATRFQPTP
jgi:type IV secretion system protein VirB5